MRRRHWSYVVGWIAICAAGCISAPDPVSRPIDAGDGDGDGGSGGDAGGDAGGTDAAVANACGLRLDFPIATFPPSAVAIAEVGIGQVISADINNDGFNDLLLANSEVTDSESWGVFVLLGPQNVAGLLSYDAFVRTTVAPRGIAVKDILGSDGCMELTVFGQNAANSTGLVEVYEYQGPPTMFPTVPIPKDVMFTPVGPDAPVMVTYGDFSGDGHGNDLVVSDVFTMRLLSTGADFSNDLRIASITPIVPDSKSTSWSAVRGVYARKSLAAGATSDDLVVVQAVDLTWLKNDGTGTFANPITASSNGFFNSRSIIPIDLDGVPPLDFIGGGSVDFGAYLLAQNGETVDITVRGWSQATGIYNEMNDLLAGDMGGGGVRLPEVIFVEADESTPNPQPGLAILSDGVYPDATSNVLHATTPSTYSLATAGFSPTRGIITEFNGYDAPEAWLFDAAGTAICLQRKASVAELEPCEVK